MPTVLKLKCQGEVRRVLLQEEVSYQDIRSKISAAWPELGQHSAKYHDEEGDLCTFCALSFDDFIALCDADGQSRAQRVLRLELFAEAQRPAPGGMAATDSGFWAHVEQHFKAQAELWKGRAEAAASPMIARIKVETEQFFKDQAERMKDQAAAQSELEWHLEESAGGHHWHGSGYGKRERLLHPRKVLWILARLRSSGHLSPSSFASLMCYILPAARAKAAEQPAEIGARLQAKEQLGPFLQDLQLMFRQTPGLEASVIHLDGLLTGTAAAAGDSLHVLLTALESLPLDAQVIFFQNVYVVAQASIHKLLDQVDAARPVGTHWADLPQAFTHEASCSACTSQPIKGLLFKCLKGCDFNLCSECYCQHGERHTDQGGQECTDVTCMVVDWASVRKTCRQGQPDWEGHWPFWKGHWGKAAGKGCFGKGGKDWHQGHGKGEDSGFKDRCKGWFWHAKGWGKGKGKATGKFWTSESEEDAGLAGQAELSGNSAEETSAHRACENPGCKFKATWHPTVCCISCVTGVHGPRCAQVLAPEVQATRLTYPVVVEDGRKLAIEWNLGDDAQQVALNFATRNNIPAEEIPTIAQFVEHASAAYRANAPVAETTTDEAVARAAALDEAAGKLQEMGFGGAQELKELLEGFGGDINRALESLTK